MSGGDRGQSEVLDVLLVVALLVGAIGLVGLVAVTEYQDIARGQPQSVELGIRVTADSIEVTHEGGAPLDVDSTLLVVRNGTGDLHRSALDSVTIAGDGDDQFEFGETASIGFTAAAGEQLSVVVVDQTTSNVVEQTTSAVPSGAPSVTFTTDCTKLDCTFDASGSSDADGTIQYYEWDFGDGTTDNVTTSTVSHTYASPGTYTVTLTATDDDGFEGTKSTEISVTDNYAPDADFSYSPTDISPGDTVSFTNQSTDSDGSIVSWAWDFDDGNTSSAQNPDHSFSTDGTYGVSLTVTDDDGATDTIVRSVLVGNAPPVAKHNGPYTVAEGSSKTLSAAGSSDPDGSIVAYNWSITADPTGGASLTNPNTSSPTFVAPSSVDSDTDVTVELSVTDDTGGTTTNTTTVTVLDSAGGNTPPVANFTTACTDYTCSFDASGSSDADGDTLSYQWAFGDSTTTGNLSSPTTSHVYATGGSYDVALTVYDNNGSQASVTKPVTVPGALVLASPSSREGSQNKHSILGFEVTNERQAAVTITAVTVDIVSYSGKAPDAVNASTLAPSQEVQVDVGDDGSVEGHADGLGSYAIGSDMTLNQTASVGTGTVANVSVREYITSNNGKAAEIAGATVNVTVTYSIDGATESTSKELVVPEGPNDPPTANFSYSPTSPDTNTAIQFTNESTDPDGTITAHYWSFGDGTSSQLVNPTHSYGDDGSYSVTLTVTDDSGVNASVSKTVTVSNVGPVANAGGPYELSEGSSTTLDGTLSSDTDGSIASWSWAIVNDPTGGASLNDTGTATPTFEAPPDVSSDTNVTVELTVTDDDGATDSSTRNVTVLDTSGNQQPTASFTSTCTGNTCSFDATGSSDPDGDSLTYEWDFGDGDTGTGPTVSHKYPGNGWPYTVTLTVRDGKGGVDTSTQTVTK